MNAMHESNVTSPTGILNPGVSATKFQLQRYAPSPDLSFFVQRFWTVCWDLRGQEPYCQETIPYPCVNLVFERGDSGIFGVVTGKFDHIIEDVGGVFGIKFKPGAFYPFYQRPVVMLTDGVIPIHEVFAVNSAELEATIMSCADASGKIALAEAMLRSKLPPEDDQVALINRIVDCIIQDRSIARVEHLAERFGISKRTLQRLFSQYVGVSPKWVIKRYRLHEAAEQLATGAIVDWSGLALDLGYYDQAHFIKDFKTIVGKPPGEYAREVVR